ncbi:MAG: nuclear transport factor 2 family protein [Rhodobacteraceae bacterium]|nr:nuclear transport factor 2 family protein [Paracoccaceae bacterium]
MTATKADQIRALLKSIETGDPGPIAVVDQSQYIQHNPQTHEGSEGLEALFKRLSLTQPRVNIVRAFEDGDFVFAHTEYDFSRRNIGFEVFRFENGRAVEHWDNIQKRMGPNASGRSMVDGPIEALDLSRTEANRALVRDFCETVLVAGQFERLEDYLAGGHLIQHNPDLTDGAAPLRAYLSSGAPDVAYTRLHRVLAQGNFVLSVCEGRLNGEPTSFYDLYRIEEGKLAEHWDTRETIPARSAWKNDNGKF